MDITIQREALLKPLQAISGIVDKKQTLPILSNVLLTAAQDGKLRLTATDTEIEFIGFVPLENLASSGQITVSAKKLFDICRTLPDSTPIRLSLDKQSLLVRAGDSRFKLNTLPVETFPKAEENNHSIQLAIKQNALKNLLVKTSFAMGQQDIRHYLNGVLLDITPNSIKCIAADGHRLALASIQDDSIGSITTKIILPRKSVLELIRLLNADSDHDLTIALGDGRCCITTSDFIFTTKLINTQYPDYNRLIPQGNSTASGDREAIKQALTRASILSNEKFRGVRFELEPNTLRISANNSDQEQADETVSLDYVGNQIEMGFNVAYLLDVLSAMTTKTIRCLFSDPDSGVLFEPAEKDDSLYVIMPMRF